MVHPVGRDPQLDDSGELTDGEGSDEGRRNWIRWSAEEHHKLSELVRKHGVNRSWSMIAVHIPGRTGKQCRERWLNHTNEGTKKGNWSHREEFILGVQHALLGSQWCRISRCLPGRTDNSVKNHWNATWRSKVMHKPQSCLWLYTTELKGGLPPPNAIKAALVKWEHNVPSHQVMEALGFWPSQTQDIPITKLFKITYQKVMDEFGNPNETTPQQDHMKVMGVSSLSSSPFPSFGFQSATKDALTPSSMVGLSSAVPAPASAPRAKLHPDQQQLPGTASAQQQRASDQSTQSKRQVPTSSGGGNQVQHTSSGNIYMSMANFAQLPARADVMTMVRHESSPHSPESRSDHSSAQLQQQYSGAHLGVEGNAPGGTSCAPLLPDCRSVVGLEGVLDSLVPPSTQTQMPMVVPGMSGGFADSTGVLSGVSQLRMASGGMHAGGQMLMGQAGGPQLQTVMVQQGPNGMLQLVAAPSRDLANGVSWAQHHGHTMMAQCHGQSVLQQVPSSMIGGQQVMSMPPSAVSAISTPSGMMLQPAGSSDTPTNGLTATGSAPGMPVAVSNSNGMQLMQVLPGAPPSAVGSSASCVASTVLQAMSPWSRVSMAALNQATAPAVGAHLPAAVGKAAEGSQEAGATAGAGGVTLTLGPSEQQALLKALLAQHGIDAVLQ